MGLIAGVLRGALAGAAGTTALNAATYADMAGRGRSTSSAPEDTVEKLADAAGVEVPGEGDTRDNRVAGLGSLNGILVGTSVGAGLGGLRALGWRPGFVVTTLLASVSAMVATDGPMALLGVTDLKKWSAADVLSDALPHLAYGMATAAALLRAEP